MTNTIESKIAIFAHLCKMTNFDRARLSMGLILMLNRHNCGFATKRNIILVLVVCSNAVSSQPLQGEKERCLHLCRLAQENGSKAQTADIQVSPWLFVKVYNLFEG